MSRLPRDIWVSCAEAGQLFIVSGRSVQSSLVYSISGQTLRGSGWDSMDHQWPFDQWRGPNLQEIIYLWAHFAKCVGIAINPPHNAFFNIVNPIILTSHFRVKKSIGSHSLPLWVLKERLRVNVHILRGVFRSVAACWTVYQWGCLDPTGSHLLYCPPPRECGGPRKGVPAMPLSFQSQSSRLLFCLSSHEGTIRNCPRPAGIKLLGKRSSSGQVWFIIRQSLLHQ